MDYLKEISQEDHDEYIQDMFNYMIKFALLVYYKQIGLVNTAYPTLMDTIHDNKSRQPDIFSIMYQNAGGTLCKIISLLPESKYIKENEEVTIGSLELLGEVDMLELTGLEEYFPIFNINTLEDLDDMTYNPTYNVFELALGKLKLDKAFEVGDKCCLIHPLSTAMLVDVSTGKQIVDKPELFRETLKPLWKAVCTIVEVNCKPRPFYCGVCSTPHYGAGTKIRFDIGGYSKEYYIDNEYLNLLSNETI